MPALQDYVVSFRVHHPTADPAGIARELGWIARRNWKVGDQRLDGAGRVLSGTYKDSYCSFGLAARRSVALPAMLERVVAHLERHRDYLLFLRKTGGTMFLWLALYVTTAAGDEISADLAKRYGDLGIGFAISISPSRRPEVEDERGNVVRAPGRRAVKAFR